MSILVTAATGQLGSLVVKDLLKKEKPQNIHVAVRNLAKLGADVPAEVHRHQADYSDVAALKKAMTGVAKVLLISSDTPGTRFQLHKNVIDAAKEAKVKLLVYTSVLHADTSPMKLAEEHKQTEDYIRSSGVPFVLLRNGWYVENFTMNYESWLAHGAVIGAWQGGKISAAARADYALAAAVVLTTTGQENKVYELAGDEAFSGQELADEVSAQSGKKVVWSPVAESAYAAMLTGFGLPNVVAEKLADADTQAAKGALRDDGGSLSKLIGRKTTSLKEAIQACIKK